MYLLDKSTVTVLLYPYILILCPDNDNRFFVTHTLISGFANEAKNSEIS